MARRPRHVPKAPAAPGSARATRAEQRKLERASDPDRVWSELGKRARAVLGQQRKERTRAEGVGVKGYRRGAPENYARRSNPYLRPPDHPPGFALTYGRRDKRFEVEWYLKGEWARGLTLRTVDDGIFDAGGSDLPPNTRVEVSTAAGDLAGQAGVAMWEAAWLRYLATAVHLRKPRPAARAKVRADLSEMRERRRKRLERIMTLAEEAGLEIDQSGRVTEIRFDEDVPF